jgi:hypothetical protein
VRSIGPILTAALRAGALPGRAGERGATTLAVDFSRHALVAQGIEQDGPNVKVGGSIPSGGTIRARYLARQLPDHVARADGAGNHHSAVGSPQAKVAPRLRVDEFQRIDAEAC